MADAKTATQKCLACSHAYPAWHTKCTMCETFNPMALRPKDAASVGQRALDEAACASAPSASLLVSSTSSSNQIASKTGAGVDSKASQGSAGLTVETHGGSGGSAGASSHAGSGGAAASDAKAKREVVGGYVYAVRVPIHVAIVGPPSLCVRLGRIGAETALGKSLKPALIKVGIAGTLDANGHYSRLTERFEALSRDVHKDLNLRINSVSDTAELRTLIAHHVAGVAVGDDDDEMDDYNNLITVTGWLPNTTTDDIESSERTVANAFGVPLPKLKAIELSERKVQYSGCTELLLTTQSLCESERTAFDSGEDAPAMSSLTLDELYDSVPSRVWTERDVEFELKREGVTVKYTAPLFKFYFDSRADMDAFLDADTTNDTSCKSAVGNGTPCQCDSYLVAPLKGMVCGNCDHHKFWHDHDVIAPSTPAVEDTRPAADAKSKEVADAKGKAPMVVAAVATAVAAVDVGDVKLVAVAPAGAAGVAGEVKVAATVVAAAPVVNGDSKAPVAGASAGGQRYYKLTIKDVVNGYQYTRSSGPLPQFIRENGVHYKLASVVERAGVQYVVVKQGTAITAEYPLHHFFALASPNICHYKLD